MTAALDRSGIREVVIGSLHESIGFLNDPRYARVGDAREMDIAFEELELDSLSTLEVLMEIEEKTGVELDPELLPELRTLNGLVDYIAVKQPGAGSGD